MTYVLETQGETLTCCPPLVVILNWSVGVFRESFLTRASVSQARVNRLWAAVKRFSQ